MKRALCLMILVTMALLCAGCSAVKKHEHDFSIKVSEIPSTCTEKGSRVMKCRKCDETETVELPLAAHQVESYTVTKPSTLTVFGEAEGICKVCHQMQTKTLYTLGFWKDDPYIISPSDLFNAVKKGQFDDYKWKWVKLTGKITAISDYSGLCGLYLYGSKGKGVVCWFDVNSQWRNTYKVGDSLTIVGMVRNEGDNGHVELTECEVSK